MRISGLILNAQSNLKEYKEGLEMDEDLLESAIDYLRSAYDLAISKGV